MQNNNIDLTVETKDGRPIRVHHHDGRSYIQANENSVYQIRVKNRTDERTKAVISVDGLNIVSGKPATADKDETGYILGPFEEQVFRGYRVDKDTVAEFTFTRREASYATQKGEGAGNGVIAIRVYEEKESKKDKRLKEMARQIEELKNRPQTVIHDHHHYRPWHPYWGYWHGGTITTTDNVWYTTANTVVGAADMQATYTKSMQGGDTMLRAMAMNSCAANVVQSSVPEEIAFSMGSTWGSAVKDSVTEVEFQTGKLIAEMAFYYTSAEGLRALGVNVDRVKAVAFPEPFKHQFCAPPSGWVK